jgi:hypothetical protein
VKSGRDSSNCRLSVVQDRFGTARRKNLTLLRPKGCALLRRNAAGRLADANLAGSVSPRTAGLTPCPSTSVNLQARTYFQAIIKAYLAGREKISKLCTTLGVMKSIEVAIHA